MSKKSDVPKPLPGRLLTKTEKSRVRKFKEELAAAKSASKATNDALAISATRYLRQLTGKEDAIGSQKINLWTLQPAGRTWTTATARSPTSDHDFAALILSLLQHGAWGEVSATNQECKKKAKEWASLLGVTPMSDSIFRLATATDDPTRDVPHMLDALLGEIFDSQINDPLQQMKRSLLCVVAVTEPSIHHDSGGLEKVVDFIARGGCYAILNPFNPLFLPLPVEYGAISEHYRNIYRMCQSLVGKLNERVGACIPGGIESARSRIKLIRPKFSEGRSAAYRMFSPVVGAIARPVLCCVQNVSSGIESSRFGTMHTDEQMKMRLQMHVDSSFDHPPTAQALHNQALVQEYCADLIKAWANAGRLQIPDDLDSEVWEID